MDSPVAVEFCILCPAVPEKEPAGQGLDAPLLQPDQLGQAKAAHGGNHRAGDVLGGVLPQVPAQLHTGRPPVALLTADIHQGAQPGVEMLLLHALKVPTAVKAGLILHRQGVNGQAVQQLCRCPVQSGPSRGGHAAPPHQPGTGRVPLRSPENAQLAPQGTHNHLQPVFSNGKAVSSLLRQNFCRLQQPFGMVYCSGKR